MGAGESVADADALAGPDAFAPLRVALAALRMLGAAAGLPLPEDLAADPATPARVLAGVAAGAAARVAQPKQRRGGPAGRARDAGGWRRRAPRCVRTPTCGARWRAQWCPS